MKGLIVFIAIVVAWFVLNRYVLRKVRRKNLSASKAGRIPANDR